MWTIEKTEGASAASRGNRATLLQWLLLSLDHVGRGMVLVGEGGEVLHANRQARNDLAGRQMPLVVEAGRLRACQARDDKLLADAIAAALNRGLQHMVTLGKGAGASAWDATAQGLPSTACTVAVLPVEYSGPAEQGLAPERAVLISLPQPSRARDLAIQIFASEHGCTRAETEVLEALLAGQTPEAIARGKRVQLCTVRTQIGQLRLKTGTRTIRELLDLVMALPPMMARVQ